jgi:DNA-binding NtrC family response regulator
MGNETNQAETKLERQPATILVVEDDALVRLMIADHLREAGHRVIEAGDGDEAMAVLSSGLVVEVVFSDVLMPGSIGGLSLAVWIRSHFPTTHVILTSGNPVAARNLLDQETMPFLPKPYKPDDVSRMILKTISHTLPTRKS